jgi:hypothetical protein
LDDFYSFTNIAAMWTLGLASFHRFAQASSECILRSGNPASECNAHVILPGIANFSSMELGQLESCQQHVRENMPAPYHLDRYYTFKTLSALLRR